MDTFYIATNYFLETVLLPKSITDIYEQVDLSDWEAVKTSLNNDLDMWLDHYISYTACVIFAVLYIILLPMIGVIVCCCRCHGNCGGLDDPIEGKHSTCQRRCYAIVLLLLCVIILFSVVIGFGATGLMYIETMESGASAVITTSLEETSEFFNEVVSQTMTLYTNVTEQHLPIIVNDIVNIPQNCQVIVNNATGIEPLLSDLDVYLSDFNSAIDNLELVHIGILDLLNSSAELEFAISDLSDNMTAELTSCSMTDLYCNITLDMVQSLSIVPKYEDLPSLETVMESLTNISSGSNSIFMALEASWQQLYQISDIINTTAGGTLNQSVDALDELQHLLLVFTNLTTASLIKLNFSHATEVMTKDISPTIEDVGLITLCICLTFLILLLILTILGFVSLGFGSCGKRPMSGPGCCSRDKGSKILLCTNYTIFSTLWLIMLGMTILFVVGSISHNDLCRHLVDPTDDPEASDTLDEIFTSYLNINSSLKETLHNCKQNTAIYIALDLDGLGNEYNISWVLDLDRLGYTDALDHLGTLNYSVEHLDILSLDLEQNLVWLDISLQSIDFSMYQSILTADVTSIDLEYFRDVLTEAADNSSEESRSRLYLSYAEQVEMLQEMFIIPMNETSMQSLNSLNQVYSFSKNLNISQYLHDLDTAEGSLTNDLVQDIIVDLSGDIYTDTSILTSSIENYMTEELGHCRSIYDSYSYTTTAVCIDFLYPFNTIWLTIGLCLLLLLLWIPISFKLASLYSKTDKYAEPFPTFTRMSFHRHNYTRSPERPRTNHGHDIQAEIAMQRLSDPRFRRSRKNISALTRPSTSTDQLILGDSTGYNNNGIIQSETDLTKLSDNSEDESDVSSTSKDADDQDIFLQQDMRGQQRSSGPYPPSTYPTYNPREITLNMHPEPMHRYRLPHRQMILTDSEDPGFMNEIYF